MSSYAHVIRKPEWPHTPWYDAGKACPSRTGWYEVITSAWRTEMFYWDDGWYAWEPARPGDGMVFFGSYTNDLWRGLQEQQ